ncbi:fluoride efflux transporter FluC [Leuconostoc rapi]|uniref:fluoride efflux transporter FluC n=1 Tax=Leuconostoc rapi TaxID=1406906 RepID=UPI00195BD00F|nr:CrcB family protein [Leuconostoc rapi]MBM7436420.1 CrcB protein [Leuconostoc rapi]
MILLSVFIGASLGTMLRYLLVMFWPFHTHIFTAVSAINMIGALCMGMLFASHQLSDMHNFWSVGLLGGFTTFSTMMVQSAQQPFYKQLIYLMVQLIGGMLCFMLGSALVIMN